MAAANESQGLKIAVAIFVTLTVIMAVSTYFAYTNYAEADAKLTKANTDLNNAKKAQSEDVQPPQTRKHASIVECSGPRVARRGKVDDGT